MTKRKLATILQWTVGAVIFCMFVYVWATTRLSKGFSGVTLYDIFALYGLLAFGLMWTHYINGTTRRLLGLVSRSTSYDMITKIAVLIFLLSHVGLLSLGLWRDGFGLPPLSYLSAYSYAAVAIVLGSISLIIFLVYELHRWYSKKTWWRYVDVLQLGAMSAIFYHALVLGREVSTEWFNAVWWALGVTFVLSAVYNYRYDRRGNRLKGGDSGVETK
jgi:hypothetical protein